MFKRLIKLLLVVAAIAAICYFAPYTYNEVRGSDCKEYLVNEYELDDMKVVAISSTIYEYDVNNKCDFSFFEKCTNDKSVYKEVTFLVNNREVTVKEDFDHNYTDNYLEVFGNLNTN